MMISLIIKSYFFILLAIAAGSITLLALGLFWIYKSLTRNNMNEDEKDIHAIAGDDVLSTQLDLARAYIETDRKALAKQILKCVVNQGSSDQRQEAKRLLSFL